MTQPPPVEQGDALPSAWRFISISNAVTYLGLAASALSIHFAAMGAWHAMAACWGCAAIADNFDGAFARRFDRTAAQAAFGRELDSLCDAVGFGLAPIAGLWLVIAPQTPIESGLFAIAALFYLVALITRLGHFNLAQRGGHDGFWGLPSTEAALVLATFLLVPDALARAWMALFALGVLMLVPFPVARPRGPWRVLFMVWLVATPVIHLWLHHGGTGA